MKDYKERFKSINKEMMWVANEEVDDVIHFIEQLISERDKEWENVVKDYTDTPTETLILKDMDK